VQASLALAGEACTPADVAEIWEPTKNVYNVERRSVRTMKNMTRGVAIKLRLVGAGHAPDEGAKILQSSPNIAGMARSYSIIAFLKLNGSGATRGNETREYV
jgi:hypothetical protein